MSCEWGNTDCKNEGIKCDLCSSRDFHYIQNKKKQFKGLKRRQDKADSRMGSEFEYQNQCKNDQLLTGVTARMTPNSGAGHIKGDTEIVGLVNIMEELKTRVIEQAPGKKTFTIQKEWLDKLHREANAANKEMWYLKFCFHENDKDTYIIVEQDMIMSMVNTLVEDRKKANLADKKIEVAERLARAQKAKANALLAENELLKAKLELAEMELAS